MPFIRSSLTKMDKIMKKFILFLFVMSVSLGLNAQTWKTQVERLTGQSKVKTLKIKPGMRVNINNLLIDNDSLRVSKNFNGHFVSGNRDSLKIKLYEVRTNRNYTNGIKEQFIYPAKYYIRNPFPDTNIMSLAIREIDFMSYQYDKKNGYGEIGEPVILGSLLVLFLSPLICYNFKESSLNLERYKYWALGSTIGIAAGIAIPISIGSIYKMHRFQFKPDWPMKGAKTWKFR
jgi:hypothetical protein